MPGSEKFPREGNSYPLQYSCLGYPMDRGAWWATVNGITESQTQLSMHTCKVQILSVYISLQRAVCWGFPGGSVVKNPSANAADTGSIPGSERSPGEGNGNLLQYSGLGNPLHTGPWLVTVYGVAKESDTTQRVNDHYHKRCTSLMEVGK